VTEEAESNSPAYDRDLFNLWIVRDGCTTRESELSLLSAAHSSGSDTAFTAVLLRDADSAEPDEDCTVTTGEWVSTYDGVAASDAQDLDIVSIRLFV